MKFTLKTAKNMNEKIGARVAFTTLRHLRSQSWIQLFCLQSWYTRRVFVVFVKQAILENSIDRVIRVPSDSKKRSQSSCTYSASKTSYRTLWFQPLLLLIRFIPHSWTCRTRPNSIRNCWSLCSRIAATGTYRHHTFSQFCWLDAKWEYVTWDAW